MAFSGSKFQGLFHKPRSVGGGLVTMELPDGCIESVHIAADTVVAADIAADSITTSELANDAVETANIKDLNVTTAKIANSAVTTGKLDEATIKYATTDLTNANIKALRATPITILAAPGAGKMVEIVSCTIFLDYGSNALTRPNADEDIVVKYNNGAGAAISGVTTAGFITATADTAITLLPAATPAELAKTACENLALVVHNDGTGEFAGNAGNDTVMRVKLAYRVHATGW